MGRPSWSDRITVERCRQISILELSRAGVFDKPVGTFWGCQWKNSSGKKPAASGTC